MSDNSSSTVVVGVDGSTLGDAAVKWADRYAQATGANIRLVAAWQWATAYGAPMMFEGYEPSTDAQVILEKAKAELTIPAERVETMIEEGPAGPVLAEAARGKDLVVVGSHGHGGVSKILLGSVSAYLVHHADCPVVVVR